MYDYIIGKQQEFLDKGGCFVALVAWWVLFLVAEVQENLTQSALFQSFVGASRRLCGCVFVASTLVLGPDKMQARTVGLLISVIILHTVLYIIHPYPSLGLGIGCSAITPHPWFIIYNGCPRDWNFTVLPLSIMWQIHPNPFCQSLIGDGCQINTSGLYAQHSEAYAQRDSPIKYRHFLNMVHMIPSILSRSRHRTVSISGNDPTRGSWFGLGLLLLGLPLVGTPRKNRWRLFDLN